MAPGQADLGVRGRAPAHRRDHWQRPPAVQPVVTFIPSVTLWRFAPPHPHQWQEKASRIGRLQYDRLSVATGFNSAASSRWDCDGRP
jgi:hypothetical protein